MTSVGKERKLFDLEAANRTLPLVTRIVRDIVEIHDRMRDVHARAQRGVEAGRMGEAEALQDRLQALAFERQEFLEELERLGVELKDPDVGLVDFPARLDGRIVNLCWKLGEERVAYWHELNAGFAGRQAVDQRF